MLLDGYMSQINHCHLLLKTKGLWINILWIANIIQNHLMIWNTDKLLI